MILTKGIITIGILNSLLGIIIILIMIIKEVSKREKENGTLGFWNLIELKFIKFMFGVK